MVKAEMKIEKFIQPYAGRDNFAEIQVSFLPSGSIASPHAAIIFSCGENNRRLPMTVSMENGRVYAYGIYETDYIFYKVKAQKISVSFVFSDGTDNGEIYDTDLVIDNTKYRHNPLRHFISMTKREKKKALTSFALNILSLPFRVLKIKQNRISFFTNRTDIPTGNIKSVYDTFKDDENFDVHILCKAGGMKSVYFQICRFLILYMTSRVVFVDDYYHLITYVKKKKGTELIQLWHACGAFKTFGFSRFHKDSDLQIYSPNHRQYDYAVVSSPGVCSYYAEAFGINEEKAVALGSPRCDAIMDKDNQLRVREEFYSAYPHLKDKKILTFAPTFRGRGNGDCYYPTDKFDTSKVLDILGDEWSVVIKLHPYLTEKFSIDKKYASRVVDCSGWDVNDVLQVTDFLVTDYSSVIFEASLLDIPMAFLTFDLEEFIAGRDFYYDFKSFVPGPMADSDEKIALIVKNNGGDIEAVRQFKQRAFGDTVGTACRNVKDFTAELLKKR